ncbi:MAG: outer membrane beta-barrel protein [Bacteroidales bacterium]|nr:outer membrane beta-barrel protein [Bacteroidales bacterium]MDD3892610.1 outer membrane beta-barrel protein [Bacteroidales bacterium]
MKKGLFVIATLVFFFMGGTTAYSQFRPNPILNDQDYEREKRLRFGFSLGLNFMDFTVKSSIKPYVSDGDSLQYFVDNSHIIPGFNVNVVSDFRIIENFHLRFLPGLAFGQRDVSFYLPNEQEPTTMKLESSFIEMPFLLKYTAKRKTNTVPYLIAGLNFRIDMAAYKKLNIEEGIMIRLVKGDFYYEIGFGLDNFLTFFKFSTEIKYSSGFLNVFANDFADGAQDYAHSISHMRSHVISLSFHFE